jgi:hypothetical protein
LETALSVQSHVDSYVWKWIEDLREDYLSLEDWETLQQYISFLKPFYRATLEAEGDNATIDQVLRSIDILVKHYKKSLQLH